MEKMSILIKTVEQAEELLREICTSRSYIVGAGEMGKYLGEFLRCKGWGWEAYVDRKGTGELCEHAILPYDGSRLDLSSNFIISSPPNIQGITNTLLSLGIEEERIYCFDSNIIIYGLYGRVNFLMSSLLEGAYRESSAGDKDPEKVYMILERHMIYEGITSNIRRFLIGIDYADRKGYIPVIDQTHYPAFEYQDNATIGIDNPWEYFFKQPGGVSLLDVKKSCNHIRYYDMDDSVNMKYLADHIWVSDNQIKRLDHWHRLVKKYIHFTDEIKMKAEMKYNEMFAKPGKVLGVKTREGMNINIEKRCCWGPLPYQPRIETILEETKRYKDEWGCKWIFLMCETTEGLKMFQEAFGTELLYVPYCRTNYDEYMSSTEIKLDILHNHNQDKRRRAEDYLIEIYLLSRCDALISGDNGAANFACIMKGGYEHMILHSYGYAPNLIS